MTSPNYQERVKKRILQESQPEIQVPQHALPAGEFSNQSLQMMNSSSKTWLWALGWILVAILSFSMVNAYLSILELLATHPILGTFLAIILGGLLLSLSVLVLRETRSLRQLKTLNEQTPSLQVLESKGEREFTLQQLKKRQKLCAANSQAAACYQHFFQTLKPHHTHEEILKIHQQQVQTVLLDAAKNQLNQASIGAGAITLLSPNGLLQTLGILWMSLRTLKRIAFVYGVRPSLLGNLKLLKIALENLAASSLIDLLTDEVANQLGGSLGDKLIANSADAITAASLNQRLGKALIKQLNR